MATIFLRATFYVISIFYLLFFRVSLSNCHFCVDMSANHILCMCISVCLCVYSLICCHIVPRTINLFKLSYRIWLLGIFNLLVISGSQYFFQLID